MKSNELFQKACFALAVSTMVGSASFAKEIDVSSYKKDIRVMTRIIETSLESASANFPGRPRIEGTYLASQGYLFNIQLNGIGSFGIPGVASWEGGRLELDIPEIIQDALADMDYGDTGSSVTIPEPVISSLDSHYKNEELQETLRELRENQREVRREVYQISREIRRIEEKDERKKLEKQLDKNTELLKQYSAQYKQELNSFKTERKAQQVQKSVDAINAVFTTICDYGQSLRSLKKDEKFTLMIKGGVNDKGEKATMAYVIEQKQIKNCSDPKKLRTNAIHYVL
ncbi:MAG: hypothetical protein DRQ47_01425 [Gammaproteobacteria bacterium]|nr:MAG: hypothetical protein DRQ47_01425 [Gammaproteobacteria bacterium]